MIGSEQDSERSDGWVTILIRIIPFERAVTRLALNEDEVMNCFSFSIEDRER